MLPNNHLNHNNPFGGHDPREILHMHGEVQRLGPVPQGFAEMLMEMPAHDAGQQPLIPVPRPQQGRVR